MVGTPGRLCDHLRNEKLRGPFETIVLDEYDKSLEIGFVEEMQDLLDAFAEKKTNHPDFRHQGFKIIAVGRSQSVANL